MEKVLLGHEDMGHGEEGVLPYLNTRFNCTRQGLDIDINRFAPTQRFPRRSTERTVQVLLHHKASTLACNKYGTRPLAVAAQHKGQSNPELCHTLPSAGGAHVLLDPPWHYPSTHAHAGFGLLDHIKVNWAEVTEALRVREQEEREAAAASGAPATPTPTPSPTPRETGGGGSPQKVGTTSSIAP